MTVRQFSIGGKGNTLMAEQVKHIRRNAYAYAMPVVDGSSALAPQQHTPEEAPQPKRREIQPMGPERKQEKKARPNHLAAVMIVGLASVLCAVCFMSLTQMARASKLQKDIVAMQKSIAQEEENNLLLRQQLTEATDGEMIRNYAVNKLGMIKPTSKQLFSITVDQSAQVNNPSSTQEDAQQGKIDWLGVLLGLLK